MGAFPLTDLHKLSTKIQSDSEFKNRLKEDKKYKDDLYQYLYHASMVNPYCPRAMLSCEKIINNMIKNGEYEQFKRQF